MGSGIYSFQSAVAEDHPVVEEVLHQCFSHKRESVGMENELK